MMEDQIWRGWSNLYRHCLASPGLKYYWDLRRELFSERFQEFIGQLKFPEQRLTVGDLLGTEPPAGR